MEATVNSVSRYKYPWWTYNRHGLLVASDMLLEHNYVDGSTGRDEKEIKINI